MTTCHVKDVHWRKYQCEHNGQIGRCQRITDLINIDNNDQLVFHNWSLTCAKCELVKNERSLLMFNDHRDESLLTIMYNHTNIQERDVGPLNYVSYRAFLTLQKIGVLIQLHEWIFMLCECVFHMPIHLSKRSFYFLTAIVFLCDHDYIYLRSLHCLIEMKCLCCH